MVSVARERAVWQLQEAKNRLSEVVRLAEAGEPQAVTRHGKCVAYLVSADEWERLAKPPLTLVEWLLSAPRAQSEDEELVIERDRGLPREIELG